MKNTITSLYWFNQKISKKISKTIKEAKSKPLKKCEKWMRSLKSWLSLTKEKEETELMLWHSNPSNKR